MKKQLVKFNGTTVTKSWFLDFIMALKLLLHTTNDAKTDRRFRPQSLGFIFTK